MSQRQMAKSRMMLTAMAMAGRAVKKSAKKAVKVTAKGAVKGTAIGAAMGAGIALVLAAGPLQAENLASPRTFAGQDDFVSRLEALALLQTLNAELLSNPSATLTLERWCERHQLVSPVRVAARLVRGADKPATAAIRQMLGVGEAEPVRYRRVQLACGDFVLSEADNWYVPARLTPEMNRLLDETDTAFGRAVQALQFRRRTLSARLLWAPLPEGWEMQAERAKPAPALLVVPPAVIEHQAVLTVPDGTPFSVVVETYTDKVLAFRRPAAP